MEEVKASREQIFWFLITGPLGTKWIEPLVQFSDKSVLKLLCIVLGNRTSKRSTTKKMVDSKLRRAGTSRCIIESDSLMGMFRRKLVTDRSLMTGFSEWLNHKNVNIEVVGTRIITTDRQVDERASWKWMLDQRASSGGENQLPKLSA